MTRRKPVKVYDNEGKTIDRYTILIPVYNSDDSAKESIGYEIVTANGNPTHPQGFGQYCTTIMGEYQPEPWEKPRTLRSLPKPLRDWIRTLR